MSLHYYINMSRTQGSTQGLRDNWKEFGEDRSDEMKGNQASTETERERDQGEPRKRGKFREIEISFHSIILLYLESDWISLIY